MFHAEVHELLSKIQSMETDFRNIGTPVTGILSLDIHMESRKVEKETSERDNSCFAGGYVGGSLRFLTILHEKS